MKSHDPAAHEDPAAAPIDERAPFTRRVFIAGAGAAAAVAAFPSEAQAFTGSDPIYRIHPAIGVARVGNAASSQFFIGPEVPGYAPLGEAPGTAVPPYKAPDGKIKPQAARFRIFEYAMIGGRLHPIREVTLKTPGVVAITWTVHLANKKASFHEFEGGQGENSLPAPLRNAWVADRRSLEIDFGPREIAGPSKGPVPFTPGGSGDPALENTPLNVNGQPVIDYLGELRTDSRGRLLVLGGKGKASYNTATPPPLPHWANNDGWFDDTSDGPVTAVVTINDKGTLRDIPMDAAGDAWVLCAPPDFAPGIPPSVTGYDLLFDLAVRSIEIPIDNGLYDPLGPLADLRRMKEDFTPGAAFELPTFVPRFGEHIEPILVAAYNLWWVNALVPAKHNSLLDPALGLPLPGSKAKREKVFEYMRPPLGVPTTKGKRNMPKNFGDDPYVGGLPDAVENLTLTHVQFALLRRWAAGAFIPAVFPLPSLPVITPHGLDKAALENCSGGPFYPGIEFGWQLRNPALFAEPFRLNLNATSGYLGEEGVPIGPGHFTRQMAVPWQADYNDCRNEGYDAWWPSQRPTHALPSKNASARADWARPDTVFEAGNEESTHEDMIAHWYRFGFVLEHGNTFVEKERAPFIP